MAGSVIFLWAVGIGLGGGLWAGQGSCTWEEVTPLLEEQPGLRRFLERTLEVSPAGLAFRFGPDFPVLDGRRTGPYRFAATSREDRPEAFELVVETIPEYFDAGGAPMLKPPFHEAAAVRERFASVRIEPAGTEAETTVTATPEDLAERTAWIQARCNEINLADSRLDVLAFPGGGKVSGRVTYHLDSSTGTIRMIAAEAAADGGSPAVAETYSFYEGELLFAFRRVTRTGGAVAEIRHYFQSGEIYRTTRKVPGPAAPAVEETVAAEDGEALRVFGKVSRLALAADAAEAAAVYANDPDLAAGPP